MTLHPTGEQYAIASSDQEAVVTELGATLRRYRVGGRDLVNGFEVDASPSGGRGQQLVPWPNRIRDGKYHFGGRDQQLWLSEPARHNASHGLVRYQPWRVVNHQPDAVRLSITIFPQPGWPGTLAVEVNYRLGPGGLVVEIEATNVGTVDVPFGYGAHPYLTAGEDQVDELTVRVPAQRYLSTDDRMLPTELHEVAGSDIDWRFGRVVGSDVLDTAFTDLDRDDSGRWEVEVSRDGRRTVLWGDQSMRWAQVFTGGPYRTWGVAVEPMTCGPNAFNEGPTHGDLLELAPGEEFTGSWGITQK